MRYSNIYIYIFDDSFSKIYLSSLARSLFRLREETLFGNRRIQYLIILQSQSVSRIDDDDDDEKDEVDEE